MLIVFHKPFDVLCQFTPDQPGQRTLAEFGFPPRVYPLGRLDMDSEGMLLLSDEPGLNNRLLDPKSAHERTYWTQVEGVPTEEAITRLRRGGLSIQGYRTLPCGVSPIADPGLPPRDPPVRYRKTVEDGWLELRLVEGKNRQVRRMTAAVGFPTLRLFRAAIGGLRWQGEAAGDWREVEERERALVFGK